MTKKELAATLKYSSPQILYIITWNNLLKKLVCPFKVIVINEVGELYLGKEVYVDEVKVDMDLKTVYLIEANAYYYFNFEIII